MHVTLWQMCEHTEIAPTFPVLASCFIVNTTLGISKDRAFARMFGAGPPKPTPYPTFAAWLVRDVFVMSAAFSLPPIVAKQLEASSIIQSNCYSSHEIFANMVFDLVYISSRNTRLWLK